VIDVAIVGGGVAGCYCAYRLAKDSKFRDIHLYEMSDRYGGRLWSKHLRGMNGEPIEGAPLELGGNFIGHLHQNVYGLLTEELGFELKEVSYYERFQYLRGKSLTDESYADPCAVPFAVETEEQAKTPYYLLRYALEKIVSDISELWPFNEEGTRRATVMRLRQVTRDGRHLWEWGFWNLLAEVVSHEAYNILLSTMGAASAFRNTNACDAVWGMMLELNSAGYKMREGYQALPETLKERAEGQVDFHAGHELKRVARNGKKLALHFAKRQGERDLVVNAEAVILAMPRRSLQRIQFDEDVFDVGFYQDLDAVLPVAASKLYLLFEQPWWYGTAIGATFIDPAHILVAPTDLPMRQCNYYGEPAIRGTALLLAAFADDVAASFWSGLVNSDYADVADPNWLAGEQELCASKAMVRAVTKQLGKMHAGVEIPKPLLPVFVDWQRDPYGAAWHAWAPNVKSWEVMRRMRQPNKRLPIFVCGEAFSQIPGWAEGAINSAEMTLAMAPFGLGRPGWVDNDYEFEL
jgi:monoamine oxidase